MTNLSGTNLNNLNAVLPKDEDRESPSGFPKYPDYKDSGVNWLGKVPEHWDVRPLKWLAEQVTDKARTSGFQVGLENIEGWAGRFIETDAEFSGNGIAFREDDILFGKLRPYLAKAWLADKAGEAVGDFFVLRPHEINGEFLHKYILTPMVINDLNASTIGAKMPRVGWEDMAALIVTLPSHEEQTQIARFLDHETARIDALIEEQQRLIELLKEKRQTVISHAVTKGLDPTAPMKDSGVEWLGEVPAHWRIGALRWYATIQGGIAKGKDYEGKETVVLPYLRVANVQNGYVNLSEIKEIAVLESEIERYSLRAGDVLMNEGGDNDKLGRGTVWQGQIEPCLHQNHVFAIRPIECLLPQWLTNFTQADQARTYFFLNSKQSTNLASISASNVMNLSIPIPSVAEQMEIIVWLEKDRESYELLVDVAQSAVTLLQERRSALISAAVTGKIDVRNWQANHLVEKESCLKVTEASANYL